MSSKTDRVKEALEALGHEPSVEEKKAIAKNCQCSVALVHKVWTRMPKPELTGIPTPSETVVKVEEQPPMEVPVEEEAPPPIEEKVPKEFKEKALPMEELAEKLEAGLLTTEDLTYVWKSVNSLFPPQHQRPDKAMEILGKLWVKPANRLIEKYAVENIDLYLAIGVTALTFAPSVVAMVRERGKEKPRKESEELVK